jgi:uncharacterized protein (DUF58 family)
MIDPPSVSAPTERKRPPPGPLQPDLSGGSWFRSPRRLKITREGKYFIFITFGVGFAGLNTGNNLLYLLFGMLLALIAVSSVMSELSLRELSVTRKLPARAQVGKAHLVEIAVHNHKGKIPSYAIEIEDLREGQPADKRCFFLKISPESAQVAAYRRTPGKRGRDRHVGFRIATRFPFGLFEKSREISSPGELVIYPAVDPLRLPPQRAGVRAGSDGSLGRAAGTEILTVRPMREGDDPRDIYWRKSTHQLVLRERASETQRHVELPLDTEFVGRAPDAAWTTRFEQRIRDVASRAVAHLKRGDSITIRTGRATVRSTPGSGADSVLRFLALVEPELVRTEPIGSGTP